MPAAILPTTGRAWTTPGGRGPTATVIKKKPSSYLEKFYFDTITFDRGMLKNMVQRYGAGQVVLGTDYPYDMGMEHPVDFIGGTPGISKADKERIMGGNAARLLKIRA